MNYNIPSAMRIEECPGFGFFPGDECLINFHLSKKNSGQAQRNWPILEIDICAFEPWDLKSLPTIGCDKYKYFFYRRQYMDERHRLYKRGTKTGYWKSTGKLRQIKGGGKKKSLVFYKKGSARGSKPVRTGWIMQEYDDGGQYVMVKLQTKDDKSKKSKLRNQNVSKNDFAEDNQIVSHGSEVVTSGCEGQSPIETTAMAIYDSEATCLTASVCNKNSPSTESGGEYQCPATISDLEYYNQNEVTGNSACQDIQAIPSQFADQICEEMTAMSIYDKGKTICQEGFGCETEKQFSTNESDGEWNPSSTSPYDNLQNEAMFGKDILFSPINFDFGWSRYNDLATANIERVTTSTGEPNLQIYYVLSAGTEQK